MTTMNERYGNGSDEILAVIDAVREIARIESLNGPSGRQLGLRVFDALNGRKVEELTIRELTQLCVGSPERKAEKDAH